MIPATPTQPCYPRCGLPIRVFAAFLLAMPVAVTSGCRSPAAPTPEPDAKFVAEFHTSRGLITVELDRALAPVSVENFLAHARAGHYDGTIFHRIVTDFVVQGGGWNPDLTERARADAAAGRPDRPIKNEWTNGLKNLRGTIAMARDEQPDTATREFYFNVQDNPKLDSARPTTGNAGYAVFGRITDGLDVLDVIRETPTREVTVPGVDDGSMKNVPVEPVMLESVVVRRAPAPRPS